MESEDQAENSMLNQSKLDAADLRIKEKQFSDLQDEVVKYVRVNSLVKDAELL